MGARGWRYDGLGQAGRQATNIRAGRGKDTTGLSNKRGSSEPLNNQMAFRAGHGGRVYCTGWIRVQAPMDKVGSSWYRVQAEVGAHRWFSEHGTILSAAGRLLQGRNRC